MHRMREFLIKGVSDEKVLLSCLILSEVRRQTPDKRMLSLTLYSTRGDTADDVLGEEQVNDDDREDRECD